MSYVTTSREYYQQLQPDGPYAPGSAGWSQAPWVTWGTNPNSAGPRRLATAGLGADAAAPPPAPVAFYRSAPKWFWPSFARSDASPYGTGQRAFDVPRSASCPSCYGARGATSLAGDTYSVIPWYCWDNADGTPNTAFVNCKDAAIAAGIKALCGGLTGEVKKQCEAGITSAQRIQWQMDACASKCKYRARPGTASATTTVVTPATTPTSLPSAASSWQDYVPQLNTTTLVVAGLVALAGAVYAQQKGWI